MKKVLISCFTAILCIVCLASCDFSLKHEHPKGEWKYDETQHWQTITCTWNKCDFNIVSEAHIYKNAVCEVCGYTPPTNSTDIAQVILDYEQSMRDELNKLHTENPEYNYYYHPIEEVHCYFVLNGELSADDIIAKYDMNNLFANADISALNAIKMIGVIFERNEFTEDMHQKLKQIRDEEESVENLFVEMERLWYQSYMPKIEYYTDDAKVLGYTASQPISMFDGKDIILKSKDEYDAYLDELLQAAEYDYEKERITAARDLYSDSFFEENALIITRMITRGSGSIKLTVNNLYVSDNTVYIVIRTDEPTMGTDDMQYAFFGFAVAKNDVVNVDKVVTLE